ncbi:hypothetical protein CFB46_20480 [Burkholderia sp. HI2761]|uniref:hypothetical protein n=1 Tax=unclassified Burkholderia TaxID=2613784 RepID=UPI000B7A8C0C|nr:MULTISPECIES: hypothetical protein [unclassified Burkholderia]MPV59420.1 hypothetical protein [Burkholderia sp. BE24]OXJ23284.1 hypothetical protein CFB46_20480 [Burkholderia sp. HI2761]
MKELTQQEIEQVSGAGYFTGGSVFDGLGNVIEAIGVGSERTGNALTLGLFAPLARAAFGVGKVLTTTAVNTGNSLLTNLFGIPTQQYVVTPFSNDIT